MKSLFVAALIGIMAASVALAAPGLWQGSGPFATGAGDRAVNALAVSGDGATLYAGTGSGTVFSYNATAWTIAVGTNPPAGGAASCTPNPVVDGAGSTCSATPNAGYSFIGWSGDCSGASCALTGVTAVKSVTANFAPDGTKIFAGASATGSGTIIASFTGGGATCGYSSARLIGAATPPPGVSFPHGLFDFTVANCAAGATLNFTITYPQPLPADTRYWQYGRTPDNVAPHWYTLPASVAGNQITFSVVDGGMGDDDLTSNGALAGRGGPGYVANTPAVAAPTLSEWEIVLLAAVLVGSGLRRMRRQEKTGG